MTFDCISPKTGQPTEYPSSAEFYKEVEEVRGEPPEKPREVKTFADAAQRLREQIGLDLRDPSEIKEAADRGYLREQIAEGVAEALEKQREAQFVDAQKPITQSPFAFTVSHAAKPQYKFFDGQKGCGCKAEGHKPKAEPVIHSRRGFGPVMTAQLARPEVEHNGTTYKIYRAAHGVKP